MIYQKPSIRLAEIEPLNSHLQLYLDCQTDVNCPGGPAPFGADCEGTQVVAAATFTGPLEPSNCTVEVNGTEADNCNTNVDTTNCDAFAVLVICDPANVTCSAGSNEFVLRCDGFVDATCEFETSKL